MADETPMGTALEAIDALDNEQAKTVLRSLLLAQKKMRIIDRFDTKSAIAMTVVAGLLTVLFFLIFVPVPESDAFKMLLSSMMTVGFATIMNYFFGSSDSSGAKDKTLGEIAKKSTGTGPGTIGPAPTTAGAPGSDSAAPTVTTETTTTTTAAPSPPTGSPFAPAAAAAAARAAIPPAPVAPAPQSPPAG